MLCGRGIEYMGCCFIFLAIVIKKVREVLFCSVFAFVVVVFLFVCLFLVCFKARGSFAVWRSVICDNLRKINNKCEKLCVSGEEMTPNIGCPSIMTPSKMGKTKGLIFYSLNEYLLNLVIILIFASSRFSYSQS